MGWTNVTYSMAGPPFNGFRTLISELDTGYSPDGSSPLYMTSLAEAIRQQDVATAIAHRADRNVAPLYDPVGPVVVIFQNVTPPSSSAGSMYDSLTMTFGFDGFLTIGEVRELSLVVVWCETSVCQGFLPRVRAILGEEGRYFLQRVATTTLDERRMDALGASMPAAIDSDAASLLFREASEVEANATRHIPPERVGIARTNVPVAILTAFDTAHERQAKEIAERKLQLATRAASYKDQIGRAQTTQAIKDAAEESEANLRLLRYTLWATVVSVLLLGGIQVWQALLQHKDAQQALLLERSSQPLAKESSDVDTPPPS